MEDSTYAIFLAFACLWVVMGGAAVIALMKADGQLLHLDKGGLVVVIPILVPLIAAFAFAAFFHEKIHAFLRSPDSPGNNCAIR